MPIIDVHFAGSLPSEADAQELAARLADALGDALAQPPGRLWLRLHPLPHYAENGGLPAGAAPVFVTVLHATPPAGEALRAEIAALTAAVAAVAGRPRERVHVEYAPAGAGRIAFGGRLVE